jgi:hypothetical protein
LAIQQLRAEACSQRSTNNTPSPEGKSQSSGLADFLKLQNLGNIRDIFYTNEGQAEGVAGKVQVYLENIVKNAIVAQQGKCRCDINANVYLDSKGGAPGPNQNELAARSKQLAEVQDKLNAMMEDAASVDKLKARICQLETKLTNSKLDRNGNYYRGVVREFFPSQVEIYKQSLGEHQCFCNLCGDDLSAMADKAAEAKFAEFKKEFESK